MVSHLAEDVVSALIDDQLNPTELAEAQAHLAACADCQHRLDEMRSVVAMLGALPEMEPQRSFALGPRAVEDPPNLIRIRRWYTATRIAAGAFAAGFVLLSASALYVDSRPASEVASTSEVLSAAPARDSAKPALAPAAPAITQQASAGAAPAAARSQPASNLADPADQIAAATSVRALPTPIPTPTAVVVAPTPVPVAVVLETRDEAAPLRNGAIGLGLLTVFSLVGAVVARHRIQSLR